MKLSSAFAPFLFTLAITTSGVQAQEFRIWSALRVGSKMLSNYDVKETISHTVLNEDAHKALFRLAEGDWARYQELKNSVVEENFEPGLKRMAYALLLEEMATNPIRRSDRSREAFTVTTQDFQQALQERENQVLKEWLDQRLGIVVARQEYGKKLREEGYPHRADESAEEIFWRWYEEQRIRIKEEFRMREVARFEQVRAGQQVRSDQVSRALKIGDLHRELTQKIERELHNKELTTQEVQALLRQDSRLELVTRRITHLSLPNTPLKRIAELNQARFQDAVELIRTQLAPELGNQRVERILYYEDQAQTLVQRYESAEELAQLSNDRLEKFVLGGSYNDFMMARLYDLAQKTKTHNPDREAIRERVNQKLRQALAWVRTQNQTGELYLTNDFQSLLFEDALARALRQHLQVDQIEDSYEKAVLDMAIWVAKFEAKKVALRDRGLVHVDFDRQQSSTTYKRLERHILQEEFREGLARFHRHEVERETYRLEINPDGRTRLSDREAWSYIRN